MTATQLIRSTAVACAGAAILAQVALGGGEPKNQWPFTRPVDARTTRAATHSSSTTEPVIQGEAKNEPPFSNPAAPAAVIVRSGNGFSWSAGAIGLAAGIGIALSGGATVALARKSPRTA